ncbi:MAG: DUF3370 domain-containing protein [Cyanobacteria bacterium P01_G01_bin.38]
MLTLLSLLALIQSEPTLETTTDLSGPQGIAPARLAQQTNSIVQPQEVRPLPGALDQVPVFNDNSPELVQTDGILLSTFPRRGKATPDAHLDYAFDGRFDIFSHHVVRSQTPGDTRTLYQAILVHNPGRRPITLNLREAASYLSQDAPWHERASVESNLSSTNFSGPGSRLMNEILRDRRQPHWPNQVEIPPGESYLLMNAPIPLRRLSVATDGTLSPGSALLPPPTQGKASGDDDRINARSTLVRLSSSGPVYVASLAMHAPATDDGGERVPTLDEWKQILIRGELASPRDLPPTSPRAARRADPLIYGRVGGVAQGSTWRATLTDRSNSNRLTIPETDRPISYVLSTLERNTFGTGQIQSAPMLARYSDTAYRANGNYGIEYNLTLPLYNDSDRNQTVTLSVQTPLQNENLQDALSFLDPPDPRVFFRGTVLFLYPDETGRRRANFTHLVQQRGQRGEPLVQIDIPPGEQRQVEVQFLYPPDATPPQVLTIEATDTATSQLE